MTFKEKFGHSEGFNRGYCQAESDYHVQSEKDRQNAFDCGYDVGYDEGISDFALYLSNKIKSEIDDCAEELNWINEIAIQLRE